MKNNIKLLLLLVSVILFSCKDKVLGPMDSDGVPPGIITVKNIERLPGGLKIQYSLPQDDDLLYVKAVYELKNGKTAEVRASYYDTKLDIFGFGDTLVHKVTLYAVDRSENKSQAIEIEGNPGKAPVKLIEETLKITADFSGARFVWKNETEAAISVLIYAQDSVTGKVEHVTTVYTSMKDYKFNLRGYKPVATKFAAVVRDRWDNFSDTIKPITPTLTPWAEVILDKTKFKLVALDNDTKWNAWEGQPQYLWDGNFLTFGHTLGDHTFPQILTIDLGAPVKLSRFRIYQRGGNNLGDTWSYYTHGNPKRYAIYGSLTLPDNTGDLSAWTKIREEDCVSKKPSGDGALTSEDIQHALDGDEYDCDPIEIRYFRLAVYETWDGSGYIDFNELTIWGSPNSK